jgi:hypothetical protein
MTMQGIIPLWRAELIGGADPSLATTIHVKYDSVAEKPIGESCNAFGR